MAEPVVARQRGCAGLGGSMLGVFGDLTSSEDPEAFGLLEHPEGWSR